MNPREREREKEKKDNNNNKFHVCSGTQKRKDSLIPSIFISLKWPFQIAINSQNMKNCVPNI